MDRTCLVPKQTIFDFDKAAKQLVRIDHETIYDIPFKLHKLAEAIENSDSVKTVNAVVCLDIRNAEGNGIVNTYSFGSCSSTEVLGILERAKWNLKP